MMGRKALARLILALGVLLVLLVVVAVEYTSRPTFCGSCHEMRPMYQTWANSAHQDVGCLRCHSEPGVAGLVRTKMKGLVEVYKHVTNTYKRPITITSDTPQFSARCVACHENIAVAERGPHNPRHRDLGLQCTRCHRGLVHDPATNRTPPGRDTCVGCHGTTSPE